MFSCVHPESSIMQIISSGSVLSGKGIYISDLIKEKLVMDPFTVNVSGLPEA